MVDFCAWIQIALNITMTISSNTCKFKLFERSRWSSCSQFLQLNPHLFILLLELLNYMNSACLIFEFVVFFLKYQKLLLNVEYSTFFIEIENFFEMLDFFLKFANESIICSIDSISLYLNHNLLSSISKLKSRYSFIDMVTNWVNCCNECCFGISTKWIL